VSRNAGSLDVDIFLDGKRHGTRRWHVCPRVGEYIGLRVAGEEKVCQVYRVVHLAPSKNAELMGWQEIDVYVSGKEDAGRAALQEQEGDG
jgi:hypothetical protein